MRSLLDEGRLALLLGRAVLLELLGRLLTLVRPWLLADEAGRLAVLDGLELMVGRLAMVGRVAVVGRVLLAVGRLLEVLAEGRPLLPLMEPVLLGALVETLPRLPLPLAWLIEP